MNSKALTSTAISEIMRVSWFSLRALGCPLGAVESVSRVLAYSEVLDGQTLAALRRNERELLLAFSGDPPRFISSDDAAGIIEASGRSMLDVGPRAVNLITGLAKQRGDSVKITIKHASDMMGWAGAATVAAQRGIGLLAIKSDPVRSWDFYSAGHQGDITSICGELNESTPDRLMAAMRNFAGSSFPATLPSISSVDSNSFALELIAFPFIADEQFIAGMSGLPGIVCRNVTLALAYAYSHGVALATEDLKFLYKLETRTWAPSSERSRTQAGFQVASPAA